MNGLLSGLNRADDHPTQRSCFTPAEVDLVATSLFGYWDDHRLPTFDAVTVRRPLRYDVPGCPTPPVNGLPRLSDAPVVSDASDRPTPEDDRPARMFWTVVCAGIALDRYAGSPYDSAGER